MLNIGCLGAARITPSALTKPTSKIENVTVKAIAARDISRARDFAREHNIPDIDESYEALISRSDIDIVYNALPPSRHEDLTIRALEAGKAVLCEKPFAMNASQAARMAQAAADTGMLLMEAFHYRFHPAFIELHECVASGRIGNIKSFEGEFSVEIDDRPGELRHTFELGGGALMDLGCYPLHWARSLLRGDPEVESAKAIEGRPNIDIAMQAELVFPEGVKAEIKTSMQKGTSFSARLTLVGSDGTITMTNPLAPQFGYQTLLKTGGDNEVISSGAKSSETTYDYQLKHFVDCFRSRTDLLLPPSDAVVNMTTIDRIYAAAGLPNRPG